MKEIVTISKLRREVQRISTPAQALSAANNTKKCEQAAKIVGQSLEQCNEYAELYLEATWLFGDLVKDIPAGNQSGIDAGLKVGTETQRKYARKFCKSTMREDIRPYIDDCNEQQDQASIAGCMSFYDGGLNHRAQGTGQNEWYTPKKYIKAVRKALGSIELDPASSDKAQEIIRAKRYFTAEDDGLEHAWKAKTVFLNPPYSQPQVWNFIDKLVVELTAGNIGSAILLTHNYTDTAWFHRAEETASAICFTRGRIKFVDAEGNECAPTQGQAFFYFGDEPGKFSKWFLDFGFVR